MKKTVSICLSIFLLFTLTSSAFAAADNKPVAKEEVVYGLLGTDGSVESIYVVNSFNTGSVTDYGSYTDVENLTDSSRITEAGDKITIDSPADRLYYQGTLNNVELPWDIAITYTLNGKDITASDLSGATGALSININITKNPDADRIFFENYALQISMLLSTKLCENISSEGATIAEAGINKQLSYIALPGKGANISVSADVRDFEMDAISINGIRLNLDIDIGDADFSGQINQLTDAIVSLDDGAGDLLDGVKSLSDGMTQYLTGLSYYKNGMKAMSKGASQLSSGISGLNSGLTELASQNDSLVAGALSMQQAAFNTVNEQLFGMGLPELTPDNYTDILSGNPALSAVKAQLDNTVSFAQGIIAYTSGVSQLESGASDLKDGASELSFSLSQAASGAQELYEGASQLSSAIKSLKEGLSEYKNGVAELRDGTDDIDAEISNQIDELLKEISGNNEVKSFVSDKNTDVASVQFVLKTDAIETLKEDVVSTSNEKVLTFWDKLLALFGID